MTVSNPPLVAGPRSPRLRLVHGAAAALTDAGPEAAATAALQPTLRMALAGSLRAATTDVRASAWHTLLEGLWAHEAIELTHAFTPDTTGGGHYAFDACLLQSLHARASQTRQVLPQALAGALPR